LLFFSLIDDALGDSDGVFDIVLVRGNYMYDRYLVGGEGLVDVFDQTLDHLLRQSVLLSDVV
jgi:hypothetical protein